jgi:dephospho-CoA kinase
MTMLITALTGGIATGKSVVSHILKDLGCYVHSADETAHALINPDLPAYKKIVDHFGQQILNPDKTINREKLGQIVFSNSEERSFLNQVVHPLVLAEKKEAIIKATKEGHHKIFVSEAALTIEAGFSDFFDKIIVTHCQKEIQIQRLIVRDHISREVAQLKIESQLSQEKKKALADYLIDTSGTMNQTIEHTERVYRYLLQDYELKESEP